MRLIQRAHAAAALLMLLLLLLLLLLLPDDSGMRVEESRAEDGEDDMLQEMLVDVSNMNVLRHLHVSSSASYT